MTTKVKKLKALLGFHKTSDPDLLKQLKLGIRTEMVEKMTVEPTWFDSL